MYDDVNECAEWLKEMLIFPCRYRQVKIQAKEKGFSQGTLREARKRLGVKTENISDECGEDWLWYIDWYVKRREQCKENRKLKRS